MRMPGTLCVCSIDDLHMPCRPDTSTRSLCHSDAHLLSNVFPSMGPFLGIYADRLVATPPALPIFTER